MDKDIDLSVFAYCTRNVDMESFYDVVAGKKKINNINDQKNWESGYFAMSMLLQRDQFLAMVKLYGGIDVVLNDDKLITIIANNFMVEKRLVIARITDLVERGWTEIDVPVVDNKHSKKRGIFSRRKRK